MPLSVDQLRQFDSNWGNLVVQQDAGGTQVKGGGLRHALASLFRMDAAQARNKATYTAIRTAIMQDDRFFAPEVKAKADQLLKGLDNGSGISASTIKGIIRQLDEMSTPEKQREAVKKAAVGHLAAMGVPGNIPASVHAKYKELAADFAAFHPNTRTSMASIKVDQRVAEFNRLMHGLFRSVGDDAEAQEVFCATLNNYTPGDGGTITLSPSDRLRGLADTVKDNLRELDEIGNSRGDAVRQSFLATLKRTGVLPPGTMTDNIRELDEIGNSRGDAVRQSFLATLKRTGVLPPGTMTELADKGAALPKCGLDLLDGQSGASAIHRAISKMAEAMDKACAELPRSLKQDLGPDNAGACLVKAAMVRLPQAARENLLAALRTNDGMNLLGYYMQNADNPKAQRMGIVYSALLTHLRAEFDDNADPGEAVRAPAVDAAALPSEALCDIATDIDDLFTGSAMRELKGAMMKGSGLDQVANPVAELKSRMNAIAKGSFVGTIVTGMDSLRVGKEGERSGPPDLDKTPTGFDLDLARAAVYDPHYITVQMDDGTTVSPTTPKEARDTLVRFITGDPNAEFELVRDDKLKTKVHILMCCMHQAAGADIAKAFGTAFDSKGVKSPFASGGGQVDTIQKFTVSKDEKGAITVNFRLHSISPAIALEMRRTKFDGLATTEPDATLDASMEVTFSPENFNELASADWAHLDTDDLRNAEKSDKPHKFATLPNKVKEQYRFTGDVRTSFSLHAETLDIHTY